MMKLKNTLLSAGAILALTQTVAQADTVVTTDGARLTGTVTSINAGVIHLKTSYAGTLKIKQDQVTSFETDEPVFVRLASGSTMSGPVKSAGSGKLKINSQDGTLQTDMSKVAASWGATAEDPAIVAQRRNWKYRGGFDLLGKDGNTEEFSIGLTLDAKLKSANDELAFFAQYEQREQNDVTTEDRIAGGVSYESFFSKTFGWYVRTELEQDEIDQIELRSTTGAGLSYRLIDNDKQTLVARSGLGYRFTSYDTAVADESSATLDFGLAHTYIYKDLFTMENNLTFVPSVDDFDVYLIVHDSGISIPLGNSQNWKIRFGIKNEYDSEPAALEKMDTTYYTRMTYSWD
ncbi:MAG: DUF481 domain-containing protein [Opitutaceae bacterium]